MLDTISPREIVAMLPRNVPPDPEAVWMHHLKSQVQWRLLEVLGGNVHLALEVLQQVMDDHERGLENWSEGCKHPPSILNSSQCACNAANVLECRCHVIVYRALADGPVWVPECGKDCAIDYGWCQCGWQGEDSKPAIRHLRAWPREL